MSHGKLQNVLNRLGSLVARRQTQDLPDQELIRRFVKHHDEKAFAALMERHGAMVLSVCGRVLGNAHDAEDACQAVFLVLARKAGSIRKQGSLGSWLHGVALRVSHKLRTSLARRHAREVVVAAKRPEANESAELTWRELLKVLDEELNRLPEVYRAPLVLCHLEGRTQDEAIRELGWTIGALRGRLERGRAILRARLIRRGITASAALATATLAPGLCSAAVPSSLVVSTLNVSVAVAAGGAFPSSIPAGVARLTEQVLRTSWLSVARTIVAGCLATAALVLGTLWATGLLENPPAENVVIERWEESTPLQQNGLHLWSVAFSPDGKRLASCAGGYLGSQGELRLWDVENGALLASIPTTWSVRAAAFAPDDKTLVTAEHDHLARLRDAGTGKVLRTFRGHHGGLDSVSFSEDGKTLVTSSWDGTAKLWDTATGEHLHTFASPGQVFAVAMGKGEGTMTSGGTDGARIWDVATGKMLHRLVGHTGTIHSIAYSPDGKTIATAGWDKTVKLWETATGKLLATLRGHRDKVLFVTFAPDGESLASSAAPWMDARNGEAPAPGEVIVWDVKTHKARARVGEHRDRVLGLAYSPDGSRLAVAGWDGSVRTWRCERRSAAQGEAAPVVELASPDLRLSLRSPPEPGAEAHVTGPDAGQCVRFEPEGLRITLPTGFAKERPITGVRFPCSLEGDFEIAVHYEVLAEPEPASAGKGPTKLIVQAQLARAKWTVANIVRRVIAEKGLQYTAWVHRADPDDAGGQNSSTETSAQAKAGTLRIVRSGPEAFFYVAEGADTEFKLIHQCDLGTEDLQSVTLAAATGGPDASLDVRFTDLSIRTGAAASIPSEGGVHPASLALLILAGVLALLALGLWLRVKWKTRAPTAQAA